ncbi:uncharacterized protein N7484_001475 [Penicillium longicatenatum]|uniref:uncharacterized protein n=1 Tax=Penicillium longicatenatum TaxID=1561947 RepID=UPI002546E178|nr:uncharacterized protein N7484_001475 [Penicillium longicatenatum]KAJ5657826.1 hypothetical protein N7484_001475 [Penicillium longicatenatum]
MDANPFRNPAGLSFPDLMNDPAFDERDKGIEDMDTCRICHGEATEEEPLFYPCKCSGSIKFVHQSCLVEWLAHSQKKHCELCKTPFRFTKLYDPNMPQNLPTPLFLKQALIQSFGTLITWLRFGLVAFVWLGWLPWSMRAIWRALFWLADGRWSTTGQQQTAAGSLAQAANNTAATAAVVSSVIPSVSSAVQSALSTPPAIHSSTDGFPAGEPMMLTLIKKVIPSLFLPASTSPGGHNGSVQTNMTGLSKARYPSWLSDVKFLITLTPYPTINNMIIDTLEGQLITLLVVVAFILLFLIREWVVQQQPMVNIAEGEREAAMRMNVNANRANEQLLPPQPARPLAHPNFGIHEQHDGAQQERHEIPPRARAASPAPSWTDSDDGLPLLERPPASNNMSTERYPQDSEGEGAASFSSFQQEYPTNSGVAGFRDILARSNGDRDEILRLIREEGREEELGWIVNALTPDSHDQNFAGPSNRAGNPSLGENYGPRDSTNSQENDSTRQQIQTNDEHVSQFLHVHEEAARPTAPQEEFENPQSIAERLMNWFWGDITPGEHDPAEAVQADEEHVVQDPALEEPFVPVPNRLEDRPVDGDMAIPADAGLDANDMDAIEGDDFEGIMDLIGMQGPIFGLLQNGVFCALLIAFTVTVGIWLPYLWGKIALVLLANPLELIVGVPMTTLTVVTDIALDTLIGVVGYVMYWLTFICKVVLSPFVAFVPLGEWIPRGKSVTTASLSLIDASTHRLNKVVKAFLVFNESDIPMFSVLSHQALRLHQARLLAFFESICAIIKFVLHDFPLRLITLGVPGALSFDPDFSQVKGYAVHLQQLFGNFTRSQLYSSSGTKLLNASTAKVVSGSVPIDYDLAVWDSKDRVIAISMGYLLATIMGYLYLRITGFLAGPNRGQRIEGVVAEVLLQAGGVMKVILIIGIEMIVFPLYCGTLLDIALLPLFSEATIISRIAFTTGSPLTSLFVHWFIGTCYMFHFALFVSMCRKILRTGVLYFIRDPDDPTFHPIRDVLERSITTQLRKIGFSALVYGTLVIVCLGGVVWGLNFAFEGVLPIHWSARAPMLEFPVDLLFYNFIMPHIIQSFKPSDALHGLYDWWFHQCAHFLRLSNFFFPDRHPEEEGHHVYRTWWAFIAGRKGDWEHPVIGAAQRAAAENENRDVYFLRDGRYVRAPASDQVRIPKGTQVFLDVTENNERVDGNLDSEEGLHGRSSNMFTKVYIPPFFRLRIAAFILLIWLFAATTGVGITIIPLIIGRKMITIFFSSPVPVNDIYAFSSGLCVVFSFGYLAYYCRAAVRAMQGNSWTHLRSPSQFGRLCAAVALDAGRLLYISAALAILLPTLFALLTELYVLIPLHTLFGDGKSHIVHVVQDWTLGVLYVQMAIKLTSWHPQSWAAAVLNGIFRDGWLRPNVHLATRALILPLLLFTAAAVVVPLSLGGILGHTVLYRVEAQQNIYRYAYLATLLFALAAWAIHLVLRWVTIWRINMRDDVYLIGERLHNFSEKRARDVGVSRRVITG